MKWVGNVQFVSGFGPEGNMFVEVFVIAPKVTMETTRAAVWSCNENEIYRLAK